MESSYSQELYEFLAETEPLMESVDSLPLETAAELYKMYKTAAKSATQSIDMIDPELRVVLCDWQDRVLDRIVDINPPLGRHNVHGIFTPSVSDYRRWTNVSLLKDKCLTGYMLAKEFDARSTILFCSTSLDYPYKDLLPGLEMLYTDTMKGSKEFYEHLREEHQKMDMLILTGMYKETYEYLEAYRKYRPDGKVYCGLDMNTYWMRRIKWDSMEAAVFSMECDVIATSCRAMRDTLNRDPRVSFPCRWIPNGFLNPYNTKIIADAQSKRNIILTVSRIGTKQKNNGELLTAFSKVYEKLPGWDLRLVGSIESDFMPFIDNYFHLFPDLRNRVTFTGAVTDKTELYKEYAQAKIFALSSIAEGGTPNVYAEALVHGCVFVTSDIDAADDITDYGELGMQYKRGDPDGLADVLVQLCEAIDEAYLQRHIPKALAYAERYYDWNRIVKKLAYMLNN